MIPEDFGYSDLQLRKNDNFGRGKTVIINYHIVPFWNPPHNYMAKLGTSAN